MGLKREEREEGALVIDSKGAIFGEVISKVAVRVINRSRTLHHLLLLSCTSSMRSVNATSQHQSHTEMGGWWWEQVLEERAVEEKYRCNKEKEGVENI